MKAKQYLDEICTRNSKSKTAYGLWGAMKEYGWSTSTAENYMKGKTLPDDAKAIDIAHALGIDPAVVLTDIVTERAMKQGGEVAKVWERIAKTMHGITASLVSAVILSALVIFSTPGESMAYDGTATSKTDQVIDIMRSLAMEIREVLGLGINQDQLGGVPLFAA